MKRLRDTADRFDACKRIQIEKGLTGWEFAMETFGHFQQMVEQKLMYDIRQSRNLKMTLLAHKS
jgi:hypothetical protein